MVRGGLSRWYAAIVAEFDGAIGATIEAVARALKGE